MPSSVSLIGPQNLGSSARKTDELSPKLRSSQDVLNLLKNEKSPQNVPPFNSHLKTMLQSSVLVEKNVGNPSATEATKYVSIV